MSHIIQPLKQEGQMTEVVVSDDTMQQLLAEMLKELKKISLHLSIINDKEITNAEVD